MLKVIKIYFLVIIPFSFLSAQTESDLKKMLEHFKSVGDSIELNKEKIDKELNKLGNTIKNKRAELPKKESSKKIINSSIIFGAIEGKLPSKKNQILSLIPKQAPTKQQLINYINSLISELKKDKGYVNDVRIAHEEISKVKGKPELLNLPFLFYYSNAPVTGIYIGLIIAEKLDYDLLHLNNIASLIIMGGNPERAIPILMYIDQNEPGNSLVTNNLGQAYFQLGDIEKAKQYLSKAIAANKYHIQANLTLGFINAKQKMNEQAKNCFINSLKGGFTDDAIDLLVELLPDENVEELIYTDIKLASVSASIESIFLNNLNNNQFIGSIGFNTTYVNPLVNSSNYPSAFNRFDDRHVRFPENAADIARFKGEIQGMQDAWRELMENFGSQFEASVQQTISTFRNNRQAEMNAPLKSKATFMIKVYGKLFEKEFLEISQLYAEKLKTASLNYANYLRPKEEACGSDYNCKCNAKNEAISRFLQEMEGPYNIYGNSSASLAANYYNAISYWASIAYSENLMMKNTLIQQAQLGYYNTMVSRFNLDVPLPCEIDPIDYSTTIETEFKSSNCPINITIPAFIFEASLNCQNFSIMVGQGLKIGYERDFTKKTSTVLYGGGVSARAGIGNFEANALGYVTFNNDNTVSDFGARVGAGGSAGEVGPFNVAAIDGQVQVGVESGFSYSSNAKIFNQPISTYQF